MSADREPVARSLEAAASQSKRRSIRARAIRDQSSITGSLAPMLSGRTLGLIRIVSRGWLGNFV